MHIYASICIHDKDLSVSQAKATVSFSAVVALIYSERRGNEVALGKRNNNSSIRTRFQLLVMHM